MIEFIGRLFGFRDVTSIHFNGLQFNAGWAADRAALVLFGCIVLGVLAVLFYLREKTAVRRRGLLVLAVVRALVLALLFLCLAEPVIVLATGQRERSVLLMLFDCTDSMNITDRLSAQDKQQLSAVVKSTANPGAEKVPGTLAPDREKVPGTFSSSGAGGDPSRIELVKDALTDGKATAFADLARRFDLRTYALDRADQVREIELAPEDRGGLNAPALAKELIAKGPTTAIGAGLNDLARRHDLRRVAGLVFFSDFDQNTGPDALEQAQHLGVPIYAVGLGPRRVVNLSLELEAPLILKKGEQVMVTVRLRQTGLTGRKGAVQLFTRRQGSTGDSGPQAAFTVVGRAREFDLDQELKEVQVPFKPEVAGRFTLRARVPRFEDEILTGDNVAERDIIVQDESLKMLFVEYEPTWEWRFIKEVFARDPLVGREGFRTFLKSADFNVRTSGKLFLDSLIRPRAEFFAYDVVFLSDVPPDMLPEHFQDMLKEYVSTFGGGLVVMAGPRFGLSALANSKIADMLPVVIDPNAQHRDAPFTLQLTPEGRSEPFMQLGATPAENDKAWGNLGKLPWYQPVAHKHPLATVLAQHPTDKCADGQTLQPIIAVRRYGAGQVIYLGFNETWRMRRKYGETYYRQFWGQMIYRLGLGRALGAQKRFRVDTDRPIDPVYQVGETVRLTVEAYDANFQPLDLPKLSARILPPGGDAAPAPPIELSIPLTRGKNIFETTFPVFAEGPYRILVRDPVTRDEVEVNIKVTPLTVERRSTVRNTGLQQSLATQTGGKALELYEVEQLKDLVQAPKQQLTTEHQFPLWNTWLFLVLGAVLMLGEWTARKLMNLQ